MIDAFRDSTAGAFFHTISGGSILSYPEQASEWEIPRSMQRQTMVSESSASVMKISQDKPSGQDASIEATPIQDIELGGYVPMSLSTDCTTSSRHGVDLKQEGNDLVEEKGKKEPPGESLTQVKSIVSWYDENDQENPKNWSLLKRVCIVALVSLLTFSVYVGSAIYTASIPGVVEHFQVSQSTATLGLSLYVIGYGLGPIIFSPLSEVPSIGRRPVYMTTLFVFILLQIPTIFANNIHTLLALRFFAGFFGSPALAMGGATISDLFSVLKLPYPIIAWSVMALCGPVIGPTIGGFAAQRNGWKWPIFELVWITSFTFLVLLFWFPETNAETILLKRARRIRKRLGNDNFYSESEIKQAHMKRSDVLFEALLRPFQLMMEPIILYCDVYIALGYAIFYLWFEAFPLVYNDIYHFNLGESGLPFMGLLVAAMFTGTTYISYNYFVVEPEDDKVDVIIPESRLTVALVAAPFIPVSLLMFGWTARASIHWIVPTIGAALYLPGLFLLFQSVLVYLPMSYPTYAASIIAGNGLFRASVAGSFPIFGKALYSTLSIGGGCSLLAAFSIVISPGLWILYKFGGRIRDRSKYATTVKLKDLST